MSVTTIFDNGDRFDSVTRLESDPAELLSLHAVSARRRFDAGRIANYATSTDGAELVLTIDYADHPGGLVREVRRFAPAPVSEAEVVTSLDGALTDDRARLTGEATA